MQGSPDRCDRPRSISSPRRKAGAFLFGVCLCGTAAAPLPTAVASDRGPRQCTEADVRGLAWLAGHWAGENPEVVAEEFWMSPREGLILGVYREDEEGAAGTYFHFVRIECGTDGLVFVIAPKDELAKTFRATNVGRQQVTFERDEDGARHRVTYSLEGEALRLQLEEQEGLEEPESRRLVYRRIPGSAVTGPAEPEAGPPR